MDKPFDSPIDIIEAFIIELELFLCIGEDTSRDYPFLIARETAEDILCLIQKGETK